MPKPVRSRKSDLSSPPPGNTGITPPPLGTPGMPIHGPGVGLSRPAQIQPTAVPSASRNRIERTAANSRARSQVRLQLEANNPAANAQQMALKLIETESSASPPLRPPSRKGIVTTGSTASQSVRARRP